MATKYYSLEEAAQVLGIAPAELNRMRERNEARAYRDGANWKFKVEDIEGLLADRKKTGDGGGEPPAEGSDDVLLTDLDFEVSDEGSGTIIGPTQGAAAALSDIQLSGESDLRLGDPGSTGPLRGRSVASTGSSDLDLTLDEDFTFEDSQIQLQNRAAGKPAGDSNVDVAGDQGLEDDDLVLGGSGSGSDITIGGDSGISLVDPTDSGLSLEEPLEFETADSESLELGEDDMLTFSEEADTESPTELKTDDDFLLTPLEEVGDEESESGSQVIALDTEEAAGGAGSGVSMAAMLDEDTGAAPGFGFEAATLGATGPAVTPGRPAFAEAPAGAAAALPEAPYSTGIVVAMGFCALFLAFAGMMSFDLLRSMWSWQEPYSFNSALMDMILGLFG